MAYRGLENNTPYKAELALLADENSRDIMLVLVKQTYDIHPDGKLTVAEEQVDICFEGEYFGEPGESSLKVAPEANFCKLATDVVLIGQAYAPKGVPVSELDAGIKVGELQMHVKVFGDRIWKKNVTAGIVNWYRTEPQAFTTMPLVFENAFGGKDLTPDNQAHYAFEPKNLVGKGVIAKKSKLDEVFLPNIEDPRNLIKSPGDRPTPVGFGFVSPDWQPRLNYAGTYDKQWEQNRLPKLPLDFKREFFNAAHPMLTAKRFLNGDEPVILVNVCEQGNITFNLPGQKPQIQIKFQFKDPQELNLDLDTVIINTDDMQAILLWRATRDIFNRIYEIEKIIVSENQEPGQVQIIPEKYEITV